MAIKKLKASVDDSGKEIMKVREVGHVHIHVHVQIVIIFMLIVIDDADSGHHLLFIINCVIRLFVCRLFPFLLSL